MTQWDPKGFIQVAHDLYDNPSEVILILCDKHAE